MSSGTCPPSKMLSLHVIRWRRHSCSARTQGGAAGATTGWCNSNLTGDTRTCSSMVCPCRWSISLWAPATWQNHTTKTTHVRGFCLPSVIWYISRVTSSPPSLLSSHTPIQSWPSPVSVYVSVKGGDEKTRTPETLNCSESKTCKARKLKLHQSVYLIR